MTTSTIAVPLPTDEKAPADRGKTFIEDDVVAVIAKVAAEQIPGIHRIGTPSLRELIRRMHYGVDAEVGQKEAAIDVEVVVEFGYPIRDIAAELRRRIIEAVETMTGRTVVEVNVYIAEIHVPRQKPARQRELV